MNLNVSNNNISMMSAMVGIPHNTGGAKQVSKEGGQTGTVSDRGFDFAEEGINESESDGSEYIKKKTPDTKGSQNAKGAQQAHQSRTNQTQQKLVSDQTVADSKGTEDTAEAKNAEAAKNTAKSAKTTGMSGLDNSKQIQFSFNKTLDEAQAGQETKQRPEIQRKKFAENLKKWVEVEYKQYVKGNDPLYSRRNLREIMQALGDTEVKSKKTGKKESSADKNEVSFSAFNKYNINQASNTLKIFEEIQVPDDHSFFELVA